MRRVSALDDAVFDRLTRLFSRQRSRRGAARAVLGTLIGSSLLGSGGAAAADSRERSSDKQSNNQPDRRRGDGDDRVAVEAQRSRGGRKRKGKDNRNDACTKAGNAPKRGKPCCKGLVRDGAGRCTATPTSECIARTCADLSATCGSVPDGCGGRSEERRVGKECRS